MTEIWKPVVGYEGLYEVSNLGRVRSVERTVKGVDGKVSRRISVVLSCYKNDRGYCLVGLCRNNRSKCFRLHRLVAMAFIPNPDNLPEVNHKDENKLNNRVDNLEWCTRGYNVRYGTAKYRIGKASWVPVVSIDKNGNETLYESMTAAAKITGIRDSSIGQCCSNYGNHKTAGGLRWRYAEKTS